MKAQIPNSGILNSRTITYSVPNPETPASLLSSTNDQAYLKQLDSAQLFADSSAINHAATKFRVMSIPFSNDPTLALLAYKTSLTHLDTDAGCW